ncbi:MAG: CoA ester lyase [Acidimicrobiaceae bacterium]|nr:CoA ester lyase [Acidimicrobiaceae bacterium]MYE96536.1 CoA ester lyase [Acidimicrobiaceae bacterium]MYI54984.1 CoA ester lyase [Acidimicrobiaceae bacterium]
MTRTSLYVPGDSPERFDKALASGADTVICDLEDTVAEAAKPSAREAVANWLRGRSGAPVWVRVNNRPDLLNVDAAMIRSLVADGVGLAGVVVPKADPGACATDFGGCPVMALIESAEGVLKVHKVASVPGVARLAMGEADLAADMGMMPSHDGLEMWPIRTRVVVASVGAGLIAPCGPVFMDLDDDEGLAATSESLRRLGFGGRSVIHPKQVAAVNAAFTPTAEEVAHAEAVMAELEAATAEGRGVAVLDDKFIDTAVIRQARSVLARVPDRSPHPGGELAANDAHSSARRCSL